MDRALEPVVVVLLAVGLDVAFGDPPNRYHPAAWIGAALGWATNTFGHGSQNALVVRGAAVTLGVAALVTVVAAGLMLITRALGLAGLIVEAIALDTMMSLQGLRRAGLAVASELSVGDVPSARKTLAWHLVSRPTADLDEAHMVSATIESLAENLTDSFVAPLCFYLAFGLPGAALYRVVNTADAMIGYHEGVLEHFGKIAARLDDVFNVIPARLSAVALAIGAALAGLDGGMALRMMWRDHARTASPNAGWTMAAMAGALRVRLEKLGAYTLGDGPLPARQHIARAARALVAAAAVAMVVLLAVDMLIHAYWR